VTLHFIANADKQTVPDLRIPRGGGGLQPSVNCLTDRPREICAPFVVLGVFALLDRFAARRFFALAGCVFAVVIARIK
jgi:hypothetical protein